MAKSIIINGYNALHASYAKTSVDHITILADNVKVEGVYFNHDVRLGKVSNCHILRCFLNDRLSATETHTNTLVDQSVVKYDYAIGAGVNYVVRNSTLESFESMNTIANKAQITNCVVWYWVWGNYCKQPYAIYMNNALGVYNSSYETIGISCSKYSEFYYNLFFRTYSCDVDFSFSDGCIQEGNIGYPYPDIFTKYFSKNLTYPAGELIKTSTGMDGTSKGIYGGIGFTALPSIPRITSSTIDSCTDAQGNINVKISATTGSN